MKKSVKIITTAVLSVLAATSVSAEDVTLYSLDNRTITVAESEVALYTASGMGWFLEKPVEMYSLDGRTITVPANNVVLHKNVGWLLEKPVEMYSLDGRTITVAADSVEAHKNVGWFLEKPVASETDKEVVSAENVSITLPGGPTIIVPSVQVDTYKTLGWVLTDVTTKPETTVPEVKEQDVYITVYSAEGAKKEIKADTLESAKAQGWYPAQDEAIYAYASFGDLNTVGAVKYMEDKQYAEALDMVQNAVLKLENTNSEYTSMLYYLRTQITEAWRTAEKSPLAYINSTFKKVDGKNAVMFEFKNISNKPIKALRINFDICNSKGEIVETNAAYYEVTDLDMKPYDNKRFTWRVQTGGEDYSIKNLKVIKATFDDGTEW